MIPERLAEIRAALEAITPGEWEVDRMTIFDPTTGRDIAEVGDSDEREFFIKAPTYVTELLAEVERLEARCEELTNYMRSSPPAPRSHTFPL